MKIEQKRGMFHRAQAKTPQDAEIFASILRDMTEWNPPYELPDRLQFPMWGGMVTVPTRFFPTERGIGFIIRGFPHGFNLIAERNVRDKEKQALADIHDFLNNRNENDGVNYPSAEFAFASEQFKRLNAEDALKSAQLDALLDSVEDSITTTTTISRRYSIDEIATEGKVSRQTMSGHANELRRRKRIKTPAGTKLTVSEKNKLLRYAELVAKPNRRRPSPTVDSAAPTS